MCLVRGVLFRQAPFFKKDYLCIMAGILILCTLIVLLMFIYIIGRLVCNDNGADFTDTLFIGLVVFWVLILAIMFFIKFVV